MISRQDVATWVALGAGLLLAGCAPMNPAQTDAGWRSADAVERTRAEALAASGRWAVEYPTWVEPVAAHRVIGNVHSVGPKGLGIYLLTGEQGHVLIDGGMAGYEGQVVAAIESLGYRIEDVALLLNTHAHFDHSGGLATLKRLSGAQLWATAADREALETGRYAGSEEDGAITAPPVTVDRVIADGEVLRQGEIELTVHLTPGHSPGCSTFTATVRDDNESFEVLFFGSATVAANRLADPPQYPGIVADYRRTFERLATLRPDVPLSNHPGLLGQGPKARAAMAGDPRAYVDRERFPALVARLREAFEERLARP